MYVWGLCWCLVVGTVPGETGTAPELPTSWGEYYRSAAARYVVQRGDQQEPLPFREQPLFNWASIDDFHGGLFAWTEGGRPAAVVTVFSFPIQGGKSRRSVHEFAVFAESPLRIRSQDEVRWDAPPLHDLPLVPGAMAPSDKANVMKLQCRRLAKEFSAHMHRREERWDLRLLPTPLLEYEKVSEEILGGGLFAFVGYSTDPEILLLVEARESLQGRQWHYQAIRFSDKSLQLSYRDQPLWESRRAGHGGHTENSEDPHYRVVRSHVVDPAVVARLAERKP